MSILLLGALSLVESRTLYFELEDLVETREIEPENLKEGAELDRDTSKYLWFGSAAFMVGENPGISAALINACVREEALIYGARNQARPLYLLHQQLKIHISQV